MYTYKYIYSIFLNAYNYVSNVATRTRVKAFELGRLLESLLIARLLKAEDSLSEVLVRSMSFLLGPGEAT